MVKPSSSEWMNGKNGEIYDELIAGYNNKRGKAERLTPFRYVKTS